MQVTHVQDHITHAVIGGAEVIEMGVSSDASLMVMLSTTLYKDQMLAVIRETLCNAWDAHIEANITDKPIQITVDETKLVIRDFGNGIPPHMMGPLYGTYGGTSKKNDGNQTGGFGLGCKAPFAYTDHFEVQSSYAGVRTIYKISKSSAERNGKPSIVPIVSFPTTESGVQVSIDIKSGLDYHRFHELVFRIVRNGEMLAIFNKSEKPLRVLPFSKTEHNWLITTERLSDHGNRSQINVRYGNVIYPVENNTAYVAVYKDILDFLDRLNRRLHSESFNIVFQAEPNTISVQPSREGLSMQEHTTATLTKLLNSFLPGIEKRIQTESENLMRERIKQSLDAKNLGNLLTIRKEIGGFKPRLEPLNKNTITIVNDNQLAAQYNSQGYYPRNPAFYKQDIKLRFDAVRQLNMIPRGHLQQAERLLLEKPNPMKLKGRAVDRLNATYVLITDWYKRHIVRPLARDLAAAPLLDIKRMYIYNRYLRNYAADHDCLRPFSATSDNEMGNYLPLLRKLVVLSTVRVDFRSRIESFPGISALGGSDNVFFYNVPSYHKARFPEIRKFFTDRGFKLIDLTAGEVWDPYVPPVKKVADPAKPKKSRLAGYPALSGVVNNSRLYREDFAFGSDRPRITNPVCFESSSISKATYRHFSLAGFDEARSVHLVKMFGDIAAIVYSEPQKDKLKEAKVISLREYTVTHVLNEVTTNPNFLAYWSEDLMRILKIQNVVTIPEELQCLRALLEVKEIRQKLGLVSMLSPQELMVLDLWYYIQEHSYRFGGINATFGGKTIKDTKDLLEKIPMSQAGQDLSLQISKSPLSGVFNLKKLQVILQDPNSQTNGAITRLAEITKTALLG